MSKERAENFDIHQIEPKVFMQKGVPVFTIKNLALLAFRTTLPIAPFLVLPPQLSLLFSFLSTTEI